MYQRAFSTLGCGDLALEEVWALADRHDIPQVELRALAGTVELPGYFASTFGSPARMAESLAGRRGRIASLDTSFRMIDGGAADRERLLEYVPWAEALGVRWLRAFDGGTVLDATALRSAADTLGWWHALRRKQGWRVDLMIETHDVLLDAGRIGKFVAAMPAASARLLWDAHHTWQKGSEDVVATWEAIRGHVVQVHVRDSIRAPGDGAACRYVLPGRGEFPMKPLRVALAREFDGVLSLEWERFWQPALPPLDDVLQAAAASGWW